MLGIKQQNILSAIEVLPSLKRKLESELDSIPEALSVVEARGSYADIFCNAIEDIANDKKALLETATDNKADIVLAYCVIDDFYGYMVGGIDNMPDFLLTWESL